MTDKGCTGSELLSTSYRGSHSTGTAQVSILDACDALGSSAVGMSVFTVEVRYPGRRLPKLFSSQNEAKFSGDASLYTCRANQGFSGVLDCFGFFL